MVLLMLFAMTVALADLTGGVSSNIVYGRVLLLLFRSVPPVLEDTLFVLMMLMLTRETMTRCFFLLACVHAWWIRELSATPGRLPLACFPLFSRIQSAMCAPV